MDLHTGTDPISVGPICIIEQYACSIITDQLKTVLEARYTLHAPLFAGLSHLIVSNILQRPSQIKHAVLICISAKLCAVEEQKD